MSVECLQWPAPDNVHACFSVRSGGVSASPYASFNLGDHVDDREIAVIENRRQLKQLTQAVDIWCWPLQAFNIH